MTQPSLFGVPPSIAEVVAEELAKPYSRYTSAFDGETFDAAADAERLGAQMRRVAKCMEGGDWLTFNEISQETGDPEASISARLRDLKNKYGFTLDKRPRGDRRRGLWEYRVTR